MQKNVLIVGMPRSGTSMTTSIFARNGYFVAEDEKNQLRAGDEFNPSGYWEAKPLIKSNAEILAAAGFKHDNTWLFEPISGEQALSIYSVPPSNEHLKLIDTFNSNKPWIWKDPRLCYTLAYWWPLLDPDNTLILLLKRKPDEIYQSFLKLKWRTGSPADKADVEIRINQHLEAAEAAIKKYNIPHIAIEYSDFKNAPGSTTKRMNAFFNLNLTVEGLGYNHKLNSTSFRGKMNRYIDKVWGLFPPELRARLKKLIPLFIWKRINPARFSK